MKSIPSLIWAKITVIFLLVSACGTSYEEPDTSIEAGRQFILAIYNGNFKRAGQLIEQDDQNKNFLTENIEKDFRSRNGFQKEALSKSSIQIIEIINVDSTTTLLHFNNAYTGKEAKLEIRKQNGLWRVNLMKLQ